ncbi:hypothetical protein, partial [Plesiomonas shigelloides]|uniref:hypothetical protein n=1 Tax=Plesiomonas shigelloides TaxID=703 RepID=UPI001C498E21
PHQSLPSLIQKVKYTAALSWRHDRFFVSALCPAHQTTQSYTEMSLGDTPSGGDLSVGGVSGQQGSFL